MLLLQILKKISVQMYNFMKLIRPNRIKFDNPSKSMCTSQSRQAWQVCTTQKSPVLPKLYMETHF